MNNCKNLKPTPIGCIPEFPFLDASFDSITNWEVMQKLGQKTNEIIAFINDVLEKKLIEYIDQRFNDIMINSMYDSDTETLILYITHDENEGGE